MAGLCPQAQPGDTGLSARELATEREDGEPTRPRVVPAELSDEDWRLVSERHLSDMVGLMLTTRHWAECRVRVIFARGASVGQDGPLLVDSFHADGGGHV